MDTTAEIPENIEMFTCCVCLELPQQEVMACPNGHLVCKQCFGGLKLCPMCRAKYPSTKLRIRSVERFLEVVKLPCPHAGAGCLEKVTRQEYKNHLAICPFSNNGVQLCRLMGYDCDFVVNTAMPCHGSVTLDHLRAEHHASMEKMFHSKFLILNLEDMDELEGNRQTPSIVRMCDHTAIIIYISYTADFLQCSAFKLGRCAGDCPYNPGQYHETPQNIPVAGEDDSLYVASIKIRKTKAPRKPVHETVAAIPVAELKELPENPRINVARIPVAQLKKNCLNTEGGTGAGGFVELEIQVYQLR